MGEDPQIIVYDSDQEREMQGEHDVEYWELRDLAIDNGRKNINEVQRDEG